MKRTITTTRITLGLVLGLALWNAEHNLQAATLTVRNTNDSETGSLRQAIADAKSGDTINFRLKDCNPCTITLTSGQLLIDKNLTIQGPGALQLTVSGGDQTRIFEISGGATVTLDGLTIRDGRAASGGGIINSGTLTVINSTVSHNSAGFSAGGGIWTIGTLKVTNSTVGDNSGNWGGGIFNGGTLKVTNSTVSYNSAAGAGGGLDLLFASATAHNLIVAGNSPDDLLGSLTSGSHNLIGVDVKSVLEHDLALNGGPTRTHKLLPNGPAVNAGDNTLAVGANSIPLTTDQRGFPRIFRGGTVDIGAFELQNYTFTGFFPPDPVDAQAGSSIPVKFSLGGYQGLDIFKPDYPASMSCSSPTPSDATDTVGASSLSYDPATDQYTYIWKTNTDWKGTCRKLVIQLNDGDGSTHEATFQFK